MKLRILTRLAVALRLATPAFGYGYTVMIGYCPADSTSLIASGTSSSALTATPSIVQGEPIVIAFNLIGGSTQYVTSDGTTTFDPKEAAVYVLTPSGQLTSGGKYVSTSGDVPSQPFAVSANTPLMKRLSPIFTQFVVDVQGILAWINDAFVGGQASFCVAGSTMTIVFNGSPPQGCSPIQLVAVNAATVNSPTMFSTTSMLQYTTMTQNPPAASGSGVISEPVSQPTGGSSGGAGGSGLSQSTTMASGIGNQQPASNSAAMSTSVTGTAYPAPTTTGTPNCYDRSPFDGTVNNNYLILCDTDLAGIDLDVVNATDISDCINQCSSYGESPDTEGDCVAVEYDILANTDPCHLKSIIGTVNRGGNSFSQAAILVNEPNAPNIDFSDPGSAPSLSSTTQMSTTAVAMSSLASGLSTNNPSTALQQSTSRSNIGLGTSQAGQSSASSSRVATQSTSAVSILGSTSSGASAASIQPHSGSATMQITLGASVTQATTKSNTPLVSASLASSSTVLLRLTTTTTAAAACLATPTTTSLCPNYNHQSINVNDDGYCYEVECSTNLAGTVLNDNSTIDTSLKNCIGECTKYNVALPFGCVGVSYLGSTYQNGHNCLLISSITGTSGNFGIDSGRLIYPGYPVANDPVFPLSSTTVQVGTSSVAKSTSTTATIPGSASASSTPAGTTSQRPQTTSATTSALVTTTSIPPTTTNQLVASSSGALSSTSTTSYVPLTCSAAPDASTICPGTSPVCYQYSSVSAPNPANFEIECASSFTGSPYQLYPASDLNDCISNYCMYANVFTGNPFTCVGVTFNTTVNVTSSTNGNQANVQNNCQTWSRITCASHGVSAFNSARLLYSGYQQMVDYSNPSYICGSGSASSSAAVVATSVATSAAVQVSTVATTVAPAPTTTTTTTTTMTTTTTTKAQVAASSSTTTSAGAAQAASSNFPNAYPQDPVCDNDLRSKYFGGQLSLNPGSSMDRLYDIDCMIDYSNANNLPFHITTQPTYNSCAAQCDAQASQANTCAAFSWNSNSGPNFGTCTLFGTVTNTYQSTTGITQTAGVHSGRWLSTKQNNLLVSVPNQLYLARPVPFQVGPISFNRQNSRDWPGGTNTWYNQWAGGESATVLDLGSVLGSGYMFRVFDQSSANLTVSPNFWFSIGAPTLTNLNQAAYSSGSTNGPTTLYTFPTNRLPSYTLAPLWGAGFILGASQYGLYYQIDLINATASPPSYGISIEWYFTQNAQDQNMFHAITTYDTARPGNWSTYFFSAGGSTANQDGGVRQSVGFQGNPSSSTQSTTYCSGVQNCIVPGSRLIFDTTQADPNAVTTYQATWFDPGSYPIGNWSYSTRPRVTS